MNITQNGIDTHKLPLRSKKIRLELLDFNLKTIDTIEANVINGSVTANANNDIRRSGNITVSIPIDLNGTTFLETVNGFSVEIGGKIWLDKYIKIFVGIENYLLDKTEWYKLGVFLINKPTKTLSANSYEMSFKCIDLMAKTTGLRNGQLSGISTLIEQGEYIEESGETIFVKTEIKDVLKTIITELGGFTKYSIYPIPSKYKYLPYDIRIGVGETVYSILKKIMDILSTWQMYFNLDGVLIIEPIPNGETDFIYPLDGVSFIDNNTQYDFENIKNQVVVYGRTNKLSYYTENTDTITTNVEYIDNGDGTLTLQLKYTTLVNQNIRIRTTNFGFLSLKENYNDLPITKINIYNNTTPYLTGANLVGFENSKNQIDINSLQPNEIYFVRIFDSPLNGDETIDTSDPTKIFFEFMGKQSVSFSLVDDNTESPYYINNGIQETNYYGRLSYSTNGENYLITIDSDNFEENNVITFMANTTNKNNPTITIQNENLDILVENIPIALNDITYDPMLENKISNDYIVLMFTFKNNYFVYNGRNPFVISKIFSGGEFNNIYADELAYERCLWELFKHSNLNNSIEIGIIPDFLIDVNMKIPFLNKWDKPYNVFEYDKFLVKSQDFQTTNNRENFVSKNNSDGEYFNIISEQEKYFITKNITYPLGISNSPQKIEAIEIYSNKNLVGENY